MNRHNDKALNRPLSIEFYCPYCQQFAAVTGDGPDRQITLRCDRKIAICQSPRVTEPEPRVTTGTCCTKGKRLNSTDSTVNGWLIDGLYDAGLAVAAQFSTRIAELAQLWGAIWSRFSFVRNGAL